MERFNHLIETYGNDHFDRVQKSKILVVGAGGIGCEILKNLVLVGFRNIDVIDLDTIDVSNLNRQFLFRPEHITKSKAVVAAEAVKLFIKDSDTVCEDVDINIKAYNMNIKNSKFNVTYFQSFHIVLNALDNIEARKHVNRLCLAANVPLLDSGTTGYIGQVMPIFKGKTSCYECVDKPTPKTYAICTIRSTPDKPVHCITWGKECFRLLFATSSDSMLYEDTANTQETSVYMDIVNRYKDTTIEHNTEQLVIIGKELLTAFYHHEINKKIEMDIYKSASKVPTPLSLQVFDKAIVGIETYASEPPSTTILTPAECCKEFIHCIIEAYRDKAVFGKYEFDKDDLIAMRFVTAASNLRSSIFSIDTLSFHDAKGIAGNIIPAIATSNAIVAGIQAMQAFKMFRVENVDQLDIDRMFPLTYLFRVPTRKGCYTQPTRPDRQCPTCYVCNQSQVSLKIDTNRTTFEYLITNVIKKKMSFNEPNIYIGTSGIFEEGDEADESLLCNLPKMLCALPSGGITDGVCVLISDFTQDLDAIRLVVTHMEEDELKKMGGDVAADLYLLNSADVESAALKTSTTLKRKRDDDSSADTIDSKKGKAANDGNDVIATSTTIDNDEDFIEVI